MLLIYVLIFILGTMVGSFLNVVILRLKNGQKFVRGRSHCPECNYQLKWYENIPLISFIILRAKCSQCKKSISWQYPSVEFVTGVLFIIPLLTKEGVGEVNINYIITLLFCWIVISFLVLIFVYDLKYYLIPDKISLPAIIIVLIFQILFIFINNSNYQLIITNYLLSSLIISGFFLLQFLASKGRWVGGGDIRLGFLMGLILGWPLGLVALFFSYILGLVITLPLLIIGKKKLKSQVPFGTFLTASTLITLFWGQHILDWYLNTIL